MAKKNHRALAPAMFIAIAVEAALLAAPPVRSQCAFDVSIVAGPACGGFESPTMGRGINETGQVVGQYTVCGFGTGEAFLWDGGPDLITLQRPPGVGGAGAWDINDDGLIAGTMILDGIGDRAFVHDATGFIDLGVPPGATASFGRGINNHGDVVGKWAFLYRDGLMIDLLPDLGTPSGESLDVNDAGLVTGWMGTSMSSDGHAYVWHDGVVTDLGVIPDGFTAVAQAINEDGWVVGSGRVNDGSFSRAFLWNGVEMLNLGTLPGFERGGAFDINDNGVIVGRAWTVAGNPNIEAAFIWQDGVMTNLNDLIPPDFDINIRVASAINNAGQITGWGDDPALNVVAVLLTPVEPPVGDLDHDCTVGLFDFVMLLQAWGQCPIGACPGDLDGNGIVGIVDFLMLLANWSL